MDECEFPSSEAEFRGLFELFGWFRQSGCCVRGDPTSRCAQRYLQLALDVGLGLFLIAVITVAVKLAWLLRNEKEPLLAWTAAFLAFDLVTSLSETWLWLGNELLPVLFIYVVVRTNIAMRKNAVAPSDRCHAGG